MTLRQFEMLSSSKSLDDLLVERLFEVEDDSGRFNKLLFAFLTDRA